MTTFPILHPASSPTLLHAQEDIFHEHSHLCPGSVCLADIQATCNEALSQCVPRQCTRCLASCTDQAIPSLTHSGVSDLSDVGLRYCCNQCGDVAQVVPRTVVCIVVCKILFNNSCMGAVAALYLITAVCRPRAQGVSEQHRL